MMEGTPSVWMCAMSSPVVIAAALVSGFAIGFLPVLVDALRATLHRQLKGSESAVDRVLPLFYFAWLPCMPLAGWLIDHWRHKDVLFLGMLACVLGVAWLGLTQRVRALAAAVLVLGAGYSAVATAGIRLMPEVLAMRPQASKVAGLNVGFVIVILGAVIAPWVVKRIVPRWGLRQGMLYLSIGFVAAAALVFLAPGTEFHQPAETPAHDTGTDVRLLLLGAVILLYFALENCLDVWQEPYVKEIGYEGRGLGWAMLIFWAAFTAMRAVTGWLPDTGFDAWILLTLVVASSIIMGNLIGANEYSSGSLGFWLTGACYGPLLPGFLALVLEIPDVSSTALGVMLALSGLDTLLVRPAMTALARRRPARTVMRVPTIIGLLMAAPLLVLALIR
jgi:MFS family permease